MEILRNNQDNLQMEDVAVLDHKEKKHTCELCGYQTFKMNDFKLHIQVLQGQET